MVRLIIDGVTLAFGILAAMGIWRAAFVEQALSKHEAVIGAPASILCAGLMIYMGAARNFSVLPLILILYVLVVYLVAKGLRATYLREKDRRGWPWPRRVFPRNRNHHHDTL
jgi:arginine exporter protein ArgO